jgi:transcriptional regulator with XRE-family HTH domain
MSLTSKNGLLQRIRRSKKTRSQLVASNLSEGIAFQIRATRDKQKKSQTDLAREAGMTANNLSRLESPDYGKQTISSLKRIADALDVALVVRFVPFSQYIDWLSGWPHLDEGLSPEALAVQGYEDEEKAGLYDLNVKYSQFFVSTTTPVQKESPIVNTGIKGSYTPQIAWSN